MGTSTLVTSAKFYNDLNSQGTKIPDGCSPALNTFYNDLNSQGTKMLEGIWDESFTFYNDLNSQGTKIARQP